MEKWNLFNSRFTYDGETAPAPAEPEIADEAVDTGAEELRSDDPDTLQRGVQNAGGEEVAAGVHQADTAQANASGAVQIDRAEHPAEEPEAEAETPDEQVLLEEIARKFGIPGLKKGSKLAQAIASELNIEKKGDQYYVNGEKLNSNNFVISVHDPESETSESFNLVGLRLEQAQQIEQTLAAAAEAEEPAAEAEAEEPTEEEPESTETVELKKGREKAKVIMLKVLRQNENQLLSVIEEDAGSEFAEKLDIDSILKNPKAQNYINLLLNSLSEKDVKQFVKSEGKIPKLTTGNLRLLAISTYADEMLAPLTEEPTAEAEDAEATDEQTLLEEIGEQLGISGLQKGSKLAQFLVENLNIEKKEDTFYFNDEEVTRDTELIPIVGPDGQLTAIKLGDLTPEKVQEIEEAMAAVETQPESTEMTKEQLKAKKQLSDNLVNLFPQMKDVISNEATQTLLNNFIRNLDKKQMDSLAKGEAAFLASPEGRELIQKTVRTSLGKENLSDKDENEMELVNDLDGLGDLEDTKLAEMLSRTFEIKDGVDANDGKLIINGTPVEKGEALTHMISALPDGDLKTKLEGVVNPDEGTAADEVSDELTKLIDGENTNLAKLQKNLDGIDKAIAKMIKGKEGDPGIGGTIMMLIQLYMAIKEAMASGDWEMAADVLKDVSEGKNPAETMKNNKTNYEKILNAQEPDLQTLLSAHTEPRGDVAKNLFSAENAKAAGVNDKQAQTLSRYMGVAKPLIQARIQNELKGQLNNIAEIKQLEGGVTELVAYNANGEPVSVEIIAGKPMRARVVEVTRETFKKNKKGEKERTRTKTPGGSFHNIADFKALGSLIAKGPEKKAAPRPKAPEPLALDLADVPPDATKEQFNEVMLSNLRTSKEQVEKYLTDNKETVIAIKLKDVAADKKEGEKTKLTAAINEFISHFTNTVDELITSLENNSDKPIKEQKAAAQDILPSFEETEGMEPIIDLYNLSTTLEGIGNPFRPDILVASTETATEGPTEAQQIAQLKEALGAKLEGKGSKEVLAIFKDFIKETDGNYRQYIRFAIIYRAKNMPDGLQNLKPGKFPREWKRKSRVAYMADRMNKVENLADAQKIAQSAGIDTKSA